MAMQETVQPTSTAARGSFLRRALLGNAIFSALCGVLLIVDAGAIAQFLGRVPIWVLILVGVGLLPFAANVFMLSRRTPLEPSSVNTIIFLDVCWVVGSILLLAVDWAAFTPGGRWAIALVADVVGLFAILQWVGLRRYQRRTG